jgi:periplasmic copper chaperone A
MSTRTLARLGVLTAATSAIALSLVAPASAHVTATPSTDAAGASTIVTFALAHGCEGSPTTKLEIQVPESVLSVSPTRSAFWDVDTTIEKLDEPQTDAHGNEVTERTASIVYTARTPLPDGVRDAVEVGLTVPDAEGETLSFPTIQTCQQGETRWVEVPAEGQDAHELESPAPGFVVTAASAEGDHHGDEAGDTETSDAEPASSTTDEPAEAAESEDGSSALGIAGLVAGLLGLAAGGLALARTRSKA